MELCDWHIYLLMIHKYRGAEKCPANRPFLKVDLFYGMLVNNKWTKGGNVVKIIHCSDIHLDSKMESNLTPQQAKERNAEILHTFSRLVDYAQQNDVKAVLIAGDMFDTQRVSRRTAGFILDRIRQAKDVDFLYLRGNHDENHGFFAEELPDNFKVFSDAWSSYRYENVVITGAELTENNWASLYAELKLKPEDTNIVMLHGQVTTQPGEECVCIPQLRGKHIHYLALGHIHSYQKEQLDQEGQYCYCGCLEGRGFDECGEKGFVLLNVENQRAEPEFVPFAARMLHEVSVDISGLETISQILGAAETAVKGISSKDLVKVTLTGTYTLQSQKDLPFLQKSLAPSFYFVKIKDESRFLIQRESYEHDASLKGEFIRLVMASDKTEEEKARIICCGIQALSGEEVMV